MFKLMKSSTEENRKLKKFGDKVQDCKVGLGLQLIKFDFVTGCPDIKIAVLLV